MKLLSFFSMLLLTAMFGKVSSFMPSMTPRSTIAIPRDSSLLQTEIVSSVIIKSSKKHSSSHLFFGNDDDSNRKNINDQDVNIKLIDNVDATTLTALGFGAIAFNFLVLANMGDIGVGGLVARMINTFQ